MRQIRLILAALLVIGPLTVNADIINLQATIDGSQANAGAGTGSLAIGAAAITFDDVTNELGWFIAWQDLSGPVLAAHFHGAALPNENAGVQVDFFGLAPGNPSTGFTVIDNGQAADLLAGLWYINIHTQAFLSGEIRGQVHVVTSTVPEPGTLALLGIGLLGMGLARRRKKA